MIKPIVKVMVMHISTVNILQKVSNTANITTYYQIESPKLAFDWHIYISPWLILKVNGQVLHNSIAKTSKK